VNLLALMRGRGQHRAADRIALLEQRNTALEAELKATRAKLAAADALIKRQCERNAALDAANEGLQKAHLVLAAQLNAYELAAIEPDLEQTQEIPIHVIPLWSRPGGYAANQVPQMAAPLGGQAA